MRGEGGFWERLSDDGEKGGRECDGVNVQWWAWRIKKEGKGQRRLNTWENVGETGKRRD